MEDQGEQKTTDSRSEQKPVKLAESEGAEGSSSSNHNDVNDLHGQTVTDASLLQSTDDTLTHETTKLMASLTLRTPNTEPLGTVETQLDAKSKSGGQTCDAVTTVDQFERSTIQSRDKEVKMFGQTGCSTNVKDDIETDELADAFKRIDLKSKETKFVISVIALVPEPDDGYNDLSDDDDDQLEISTECKAELNRMLQDGFPYTTVKPEGKPNVPKTCEDVRSGDVVCHTSRVVKPLIETLETTGLDERDRNKLSSVSISIALNRMRSLSARRNKLLMTELASRFYTSIRYEMFGFFWTCQWYDKRKRDKVAFEKVKKFYDKLKKVDKKKAEEFRSLSETNIETPYCQLREYAKNHDSTNILISEFRNEKTAGSLYLSLIDSDTVSFNGVYSAYLRIVSGLAPDLPTVMSTGYEFPIDGEDGGAYKLASQIDRKIRVVTAAKNGLFVYYPEPNTCILIPPEMCKLPESFIHKDNRFKCRLESAALIQNILANTAVRPNPRFVFSDDSPVIIAIPDRARYNQIHHTRIRFSQALRKGGFYTKQDVENCKQVSQSHFRGYNRYESVLRHLTIFDNKPRCKKQLAAIYKSTKEDIEEHMANLRLRLKTSNDQLVEAELLSNIALASEAVRDCVKQFYDSAVVEEINEVALANGSVEEFSNYIRIWLNKDASWDNFHAGVLKDCPKAFENFKLILEGIHDGRHFEDFVAAVENNHQATELLHAYDENPFHLQFMASDDPSSLIYTSDDPELIRFGLEHHDKLLELDGLSGGSKEAFSEFIHSCLSEDKSMQDFEIRVVKSCPNGFSEFSNILTKLLKNSNDFEDFVEAVEQRDYLATDILYAYNRNPLHLKVMAAYDATTFVYEESSNAEFVSFAMEHYDVDVEYVRSQLFHSDQSDNNELATFEMIRGYDS